MLPTDGSDVGSEATPMTLVKTNADTWSATVTIEWNALGWDYALSLSWNTATGTYSNWAAGSINGTLNSIADGLVTNIDAMTEYSASRTWTGIFTITSWTWTFDVSDIIVPSSIDWGLATNKEIAKVSLYKWSVSSSNLLDEVSWSNLASGVATFDWFDVDINANATQAFVITVDVVDWADAVANSPVTATLTSISAEDDEGDDVVVKKASTNTELISSDVLPSDKDITITNAGKIFITGDDNNSDNEYTKTILAGSSETVYSVDVLAQNEAVDVEKVVFYYSWTNLDKAVNKAYLYYNNTLVGTATSSDILKWATSAIGTITFDNMTWLDIQEENAELKLKLETNTIGYEKAGRTVMNATITDVVVVSSDADWVDSGKEAEVKLDTAYLSKAFSIVPVTIVASVTQSLSTWTAKLKITVDTGDNTVKDNNSAPVIRIQDTWGFVFTELGNVAADPAYTIYKEWNSASWGTISHNGVFAPVNIESADLTISDSKIYVIVPTATVDTTYTLNLNKNGIK